MVSSDATVAKRVEQLRAMFKRLAQGDRPLSTSQLLLEKKGHWTTNVLRALVANQVLERLLADRCYWYRLIGEPLCDEVMLCRYARVSATHQPQKAPAPPLPNAAPTIPIAISLPPEDLAEILHVMRIVVPDLIEAVRQMQVKMDTLYRAWFPESGNETPETHEVVDASPVG